MWGVFVAALVMWVRTFFVGDVVGVGWWDREAIVYRYVMVRWEGDFARAEVRATRGPVAGRPDWSLPYDGVWWRWDRRPPAWQGWWSWAWWDHYVDSQTGGPTTEVWRAQVRPWLVVVVVGIVPGCWAMRRVRRRNRVRDGCCVECGYDLRASAGRCPECGTEMGSREPASS